MNQGAYELSVASAEGALTGVMRAVTYEHHAKTSR